MLNVESWNEASAKITKKQIATQFQDEEEEGKDDEDDMEQIGTRSAPGRGVSARDGPDKPPTKTECPRPAGADNSNGGATGER